MRRSCLVSGVLLASTLGAQTPPLVHVVSGVVFDSVAHAPLAGAVVQIVRTDSAGRTLTAISDDSGRFRITGLPSGHFAIGFQHSALEALGLESPLRAVDMDADTSITVDLAIPSGEAVRAKRCGQTAKDATDGMLAGFVLDVARATYIPGAVVVVQWPELVRKNDKAGNAPRRVTATVGPDGVYLACGIPGDAWVSVRVAQPGYRAMDGTVAMPRGGAARVDFRLVDSGLVRGTASLAGRVLRQDRTRLASGHATIAALGVDVPIRDGAFSMTGLPAGTWDVEARSIGYEPHAVLVQLTEHAVASAIITITQKVQALEPVSIVGTAARDLRILDEMAERHRANNGTMFLPGNSWLKSAYFAADVLRAAKGFNYKDPGRIWSRGCDAGVMSLGHSRPKFLVVYLDGGRLPGGFATLNNMIAIDQVLAIEAYPDVISAPVQWRTLDACAVVVVWTKQRQR